MPHEKHIEITESDLKFIYGDDYVYLVDEILSNCFCGTCLDQERGSTITNYRIFVNDLNDLVFRGVCATCGGVVGRYVETGEDEEYVGRITEVLSKVVEK